MKIGVALSGGGAKAAVHLGVLKALEEKNKTPQVLSGTSSGGIIAALYSSGNSPDKIFELVQKFPLMKVARLVFRGNGFFSLHGLIQYFKPYLKETFEELEIPLTVNATNLEEGKSVYFSEGALLPVLQASASIPVIFQPTKINGQYLVDGGILNNLPIEPLLGQVDYIIGVHSNPLGKIRRIGNVKKMFERVFQASVVQNVELRKYQCDLFIEPQEMGNYEVFGLKKAQEMFDIGYKATLELLKD